MKKSWKNTINVLEDKHPTDENQEKFVSIGEVYRKVINILQKYLRFVIFLRFLQIGFLDI